MADNYLSLQIMAKYSLLGHFIIWRRKNLPTRSYLLLLSVVVGIASGLSALILKTAVFKMRGLLLNDLKFDYHNFFILIYPAIGILITVFIKKFLLRDPVRHNITSILHSISRNHSRLKGHKVYSSILGATFTAGFGGSIGLESPIISSGSAIGSNLGRILHLNYKQITLMLACGAAGAISAIFNTPIAAVVFAIEVLLIDMTRFTLIPLLMASVSGTITTKIFIDKEILFDIALSDNFAVSDVPFYTIFAVVCGVISLYFTKIFIYIEQLLLSIKKHRLRLLYGTFTLGIVIFLFPPLWGEGFETIKQLLSGNYENIINDSLFYSLKSQMFFVIIFFTFLCLLKAIATVVTIGAGGVGGIFAPSLFTGAISGFLFAFTLNALNLDLQLSNSNFVLVGMAAVLSGVLHAPLTGVFLIAEITSGYELIIPLMLCSTISYFTVKSFEHESIITHQLSKRGQLITHHKDKAVLNFMSLKSLIETDLETISLDANLGELVKLIAKSRRNLFPVVSEDNILAGVIVLDDVRELMFHSELYETTMVRNIMQFPPAYIYTNDTMYSVMRKFKSTNAWNLPVIDEGIYVGFVSKSKMFSVYRQLLVDLSED